ncbi:MAG: cytochrome c biogenesis protein ResB [Limisphaerales bacterium]
MRLDKLFEFFASLKLSVVILTLSGVLVFWGTLAQVKLGLYQAQHEFFRSFLIYWSPAGSDLRIPIFPGGYTLGFLLLLNLLASQIKTFELSWRKFGLQLVHVGIMLLLVGQLATDLLSVESTMHIREGGSKNYSEMDRFAELVIVEELPGDKQRVSAIPQKQLADGKEFRLADLPFTVRVQRYFPNSRVGQRDATTTLPAAATQGVGAQAFVQPAPLETAMNRRDMPSAIVELIRPGGSLGSWLATYWLERPQSFTVEGRNFQISMRPRRLYKDYTIYLESFRHEVYPGTRIPKDFSSMVRVVNHRTGEERPVRIYMNNPLRYGGETYYQASFDQDDKGTVLQVVRNPSWLTPYFGCLIVGIGLCWQFLAHLIPFLKRKVAP